MTMTQFHYDQLLPFPKPSQNDLHMAETENFALWKGLRLLDYSQPRKILS